MACIVVSPSLLSVLFCFSSHVIGCCSWRRINVSKCIIAQLIRCVEAIRAAVVSDTNFPI